MNAGSTFWKFALSALFFLWAITAVTPVQDTPFDEYVAQAASAHEDEFAALLERARQEVSDGRSPSLFNAIDRLASRERIDLSKYFPDLNLSEIKNIERRNDRALRMLQRRAQGELRLGLDLAGGVAVTYSLNESALAENEYERQDQLEDARQIIADRVDAYGVAEPVIRLKGGNRIEVQMPGVNTRDNSDVVETIGKPALLEFSLVHRTADPATVPVPPLGYVRMVEEIETASGEIIERPLYVKAIPEMGGSEISGATYRPGEFGGYKVMMSFTSAGAKRFEDVTRRIAEENQRTGSVGRLAIILDGKLQSAPRVEKVIPGGSAEITGRFTQLEAQGLANALNNPLEVGLKVDETYEIGPSLAKGAKESSINAGIIGGLLVVIFMVAYYWISGALAMVAVGFNVLWVLAWLAYFNATITLPSVAALVLTIGMAVDANILIFERLREELMAGKNVKAALTAGYDKAFSTIIDANLTTLITAGLLYWLGTGPVKGFGLTLAIGIFGTLFSALIVSRWMFDLAVWKGGLKRVLGLHIFRETQIEFLKYSRRAFAVSWIIVALGVVGTIFHWNTIFGIDFIGGDEVTVTYQSAVPAQEVEGLAATSMERLEQLFSQLSNPDDALADSIAAVRERGEIGELSALYQEPLGGGQASLTIQTLPEHGPVVAQLLLASFPASGFEVGGVTQIGPSVGAEVARGAFISMILALLGILLYVAFRFEWGFGIGAIVSTVHDALMTVGLFVFLGEFLGIGSGQFTAPMIAAILMVLGYSINDTIVVFDRIREELELNPGMELRKVVHLAINKTLSRTFLTSFTTFLATLALYLFGAGIIVDFALVFMIGIITGTFSSVFIASPVFFWYHKGDRRKAEERHLLPTYDWHTTGEQSAESAKS